MLLKQLLGPSIDSFGQDMLGRNGHYQRARYPNPSMLGAIKTPGEPRRHPKGATPEKQWFARQTVAILQGFFHHLTCEVVKDAFIHPGLSSLALSKGHVRGTFPCIFLERLDEDVLVIG